MVTALGRVNLVSGKEDPVLSDRRFRNAIAFILRGAGSGRPNAERFQASVQPAMLPA